MRKALTLAILLMLVLAPMGRLVYAQEESSTGETGTGDPDTDETGAEDPGGGEIEEEPEDGLDGGEEAPGGEGGLMDPLVLQQIREIAQLRYQELYDLIFGSTTDGQGAEEDGGAAEEPSEDDGGEEEAADETPGEDSTDESDSGEASEEESPDQEDEEDETLYDGPDIPEGVDPAIRNAFIHAWMAIQQAGQQEENNPVAAANGYMRALKQLRNAYRKYEKDHPEVAEALEEPPEEEPQAEEEPTPEELDAVQQQLVERFQERFRQRIQAMFESYNNVVDSLSPDDSAKALNALIKAEQKLLRIQERLEAGDVEGAVEELEETDEELASEFDSLEDQAAAQMFKTIDKLEAKIRRLEEKASRKASAGEDTSELDELVESLRGNKNKTEEWFSNRGHQGGNSNPGNPDKDNKPDNPGKGKGKNKNN